MIPALKILESEAGTLNLQAAWQYFWMTGTLSSFLDNAPTYLTFAAMASGTVGGSVEDLSVLLHSPAGQNMLRAISCGAVLMGANTYIGNGPNFMVKSIAETSQVEMPSFGGYMIYSAVVLLPVFLLVAAFAGSMSVAIDATAGERERNSLEPLMIHPVSPVSIMVGKWVAAAVVSTATVILMVAITAVVLSLPQIRAIDLPVGLSSRDALAVLLILAPLAFLAPSLQMLTSVFATSYKEAQTQVSLLLLVPMIPGFLLAFGSVSEKWWHRVAPIVSQQLLLGDVLGGRMPGPFAILLPATATLITAVAAVGLTSRLLTRERVARGPA